MTKKMSLRINRFVFRTFALRLPLFVVLFIVLSPIAWTIVTSLKPEATMLQLPLQYWPQKATFDNFIYAWYNSKFSLYTFNTFFVSAVTAMIVIVLTSLGSYALCRYTFVGKGAITLILLTTQLIPGTMLLIPFFSIFNALGLISKLSSLIIVFVAFDLPFNTLLMKNFVENIPASLEEAAMVDGCSRLRVIFTIVMPMLVPGIIAIGAFSFIASWNEFMLPLILINDPAKFTITIGLSYMIGAYSTKYTALAAGSIISLIVPMLLFNFMQKYLVAGITTGAVKG